MRLNLSLKFIIGCCLTLLLALGSTFYVINQRQEELITQQAENEARSVFRQIVLMRKWIADHGGIFVEKLPWLEPTPFVDDPEIIDKQGRRFVRETPAMVTKELSLYAREKGMYWFHITSLKLTNPENAPDDFEKRALLAFEQQNLTERISTETINNQPFLRYIAPLYVEEVCLDCHRQQGYQVGDVRGAISVTLPMSETLAAAAHNRRIMFGAMLLTVFILSGALILMTKRLVLNPVSRLRDSLRQFSQGRSYDAATLPRTGDELEELGRAFAEMADRLGEYHQDLEEKVAAATMDLAVANRQLQASNQQLAALNERKSDFVARASHELRTPLTSISGSLEYLDARFAALPPETADSCQLNELHDFFALIQKNTERLIRMVNTMLDLERIETNTAEAITPATFDLTTVIGETLTTFAQTAQKQQVELYAELPEALPTVADEDRIRQVLTNLLANALRFAPVHSRVSVAAQATEDGVKVTVSDQGPGVEAAIREKIFDKFYKVGNKKGSGLGLAICRSIIGAHGGTMGVGESSTGTGARFFFTIP
ncbi:MAG: DUF3365 domain-containing protein [Desulfurivibrio sp.]|nr:DUF3365 domain-containing protein [Desulfurivibrio sp.]